MLHAWGDGWLVEGAERRREGEGTAWVQVRGALGSIYRVRLRLRLRVRLRVRVKVKG